MNSFEIIKAATARVIAIEQAAATLKLYPELLEKEPTLSLFVKLLGTIQCDRDRQLPSLSNPDTALGAPAQKAA